MNYRTAGLLTALCIAAFPIEKAAARILKDAVESVDRAVVNAGESVERATRALQEAVERSPSPSAREDIGRAQQAIKEAEERQREVESLLAKLAMVSAQTEKDQEALGKERDELLKTKAELEVRERLFQFGFFTSLTAALIAALGIVLQWPTIRLEKQLKSLQIREKEFALKQKAAWLNRLQPNQLLNAASGEVAQPRADSPNSS